MAVADTRVDLLRADPTGPRAGSRSASTHVHSASSTWTSGTPATPTENRRNVVVRRPGRRSGATSPKSTATGPPGVGDDEPPGGQVGGQLALPQPLARGRGAHPERPVHRGRVERPHRHARLHDGEQQRVPREARRAEPAVHEALEDRRLRRGAVDVGVQPDVAEEDPVRGGHGLAAQLEGPRAAEAVRQQREPPADARRAAAVHGAARRSPRAAGRAARRPRRGRPIPGAGRRSPGRPGGARGRRTAAPARPRPGRRAPCPARGRPGRRRSGAGRPRRRRGWPGSRRGPGRPGTTTGGAGRAAAARRDPPAARRPRPGRRDGVAPRGRGRRARRRSATPRR